MNLKKTTFAIMLLSYATFSQAGTMGDDKPVNHFYLGGDASYTWNSMDFVSLNELAPQNSSNGWGGRASAGYVYNYTNKLALTGELGGGYYGDLYFRMPLRGVTGRNSIDGYDFLVGFMYSTVMDLKILGSVGFMSQNVRSRVTTNSGAAVQGNLVSGTVTTHSNLAQTLPELKAGLLYPVYNNFDLTVSYMHVFGANTGRTLTAAASPGSISVNGNINDQNPTLNTILFGLRYNFV